MGKINFVAFGAKFFDETEKHKGVKPKEREKRGFALGEAKGAAAETLQGSLTTFTRAVFT